MRKLILVLVLFLNYNWTSAQVIAFQENFDGSPILMNFTPGWTVDPTLQVSAPNSYRGQYGPGVAGGIAAETQVFSLTGNNYVRLEFDQICKIDFTDSAIIEVSVNAGPFVKLVNGSTCYYQGGSPTFVNSGNKFSSASYPLWQPGQPGTNPTNAWWEHETFDISLTAANANAIKIRWRAADDGSGNGLSSYGWNIDNIVVTAAPCELVPPSISFAGHTFFDCDVYNLGPFDVYADLFDSSGVIHDIPDSTELYWTVNGGPVNSFGGFVYLQDNTYAAQIYTPVADGDTVCWWMQVIDASGCSNITRYPATGCVQFVVHDGFKIPFCDNFDCMSNNWSDSVTTGSRWKRLFPQNPPLTTTHSGSQSWGVGLDSVYLSTTQSYLYSPVFDFTGINAMNMTFWYQNATDQFSDDGVYLQYMSTTNPNWTTIGSVNDPNGTNWYNYITFSGQPIWRGSTPGWIRGRYKLGTIPGLQNTTNVQFRYGFTSDGFGTATGFSLDDFCIIEASPNDAGVANTVLPACGGAVGANTSVSPQVNIENFGTTPITSVDVVYSINGGTPVTFTYTGTIPVATDTVVTLPPFTSPSGSFNVCFWTNYAGDGDHSNDTVCCTFVGIPTLTPPLCDNFDGANNGWLSTNDPAASQITNWELGVPNFGQTNSTHNNSPGCWDINLNTVYDNNAKSYLYSPFFDFSAIGAARLDLWLNFNTEEAYDGTRIDYSPDGGVTWKLLGDTVPSQCGTNWYNKASIFSSNQQAWAGNSANIFGGWFEASYKFCCQTDILNNPNPVQFRFVFTSDGSVTYDGFSIDDFCILASTGTDLGVSAIIQPATSLPAGSPTTVVVNVENFGATLLTSFDVTYTVNGLNPLTVTYSGNLPPCSSTQVTLPSTTFVTGPNTICAYTTVAGDTNTTNDTACVTLVGIPTLTPTYCDDFDSANNIWVSQNDPAGDPGSNWELGTPNFGVTTGTHSGINSWDINLNTAYTNSAFSYLYSPFFDVSAISSGRINFWINYNTELNWDGTRLEFTNDQGATWNVIGAMGDPCGINWYDLQSINSSQLPAWAGNSGGWKEASYKLCCTSNLFNNPTPIQFRFVFTSDFSVTYDGFSIDDFCFSASTGDDVGVSAINSPSGGLPVGTPVPITVTLENYGSSAVTTFPVTYTVNGLNPVTVIWTGNLAPCTNTTFTLPATTFIAGVNTICSWTSLPTDVNSSNDTTCAEVIGQPIITPTYQQSYTDSFELGNIGWAPETGVGANPATIWELGYPSYLATTGAHSGNTAWDVNLTSAPGPNAFAVLKTPYFDLTNAAQAVISWWQNLQIDFNDQLYIDYSVNSGPWTRLGTSGSPNGTNWYNGAGDFWSGTSTGYLFTQFKDITSYTTQAALVQFRFVLTTSGFTTSTGVSIDDFNISVPIPLSVTPLAVNTQVPNQLIFPGQSVAFASPIKNNGVNPVFNHNATLTIDGTIISTGQVTYSPTLNNNAVQTYLFPNSWNAMPGNHTVCVYTDSPNGSTDLNTLDDTVCSQITVFDSVSVTQYPYCENFDNPGSRPWISVNAFNYARNSNWEVGAPAQTYLHNAHSGANAWTVGLDRNYANTDSSGLFTSLFRIQSQHCYRFGFWQQYRMEYGSDGGTVEYSDDYGSSWKPIDFSGSPNIIVNGPTANYTFVATLSSLDPSLRGFTGFQNNWFYTEKVIRPDVDGQLLLRFRFASDYSTVDEGWSIDDFCWNDLGICAPLGVNEFIYGDFGMSQNYPNPANDNTAIDYLIPNAGQVNIKLTDMLGQTIAVLADQKEARGTHTVNFNTATLAPGLYVYTLTFEGQQVTKRMIITR